MVKKILTWTVGVLIVSNFAWATQSVAAAVEDMGVAAESATPVVIKDVSVAADATDQKTVTAMAGIAEDQIPLKINSSPKAIESAANGNKLMLTFIIVATMLGGAYYWIRRNSIANKGSKSNMQIKVLSQHFLGPKKSLAIVRVAGESILIGVTDQNISMIKALSLLDDEVPQETPENFEKTMSEKNEMLSQAEEIEDDFSFAGLKTTVAQKLKSMRSIQ